MDNPQLNITPRAAARIKAVTPADAHALRIAVNGGGCSGFQYEFKLEAQKCEDDLIFAADDVTVLVDSVSMVYMAGSTLDFVDELIGQSFKIINPIAKSSCGCGVSFSV